MDHIFDPGAFFDVSRSEHESLFNGLSLVWQVLGRLAAYLEYTAINRIECRIPPQTMVRGPVRIGKGVSVEPGAMIIGPAVIGSGTVIRHGAYIRPYSLVGRNCVIGHATELKYCILLDGAQVPHFNYVGDSIVGHDALLGAGAKLANVRHDQKEIAVVAEGKRIGTGLSKFGSVIGDGARLGCNAVCCPGTLVGPAAQVYPTALVRGVVPPNSVVKAAVGGVEPL